MNISISRILLAAAACFVAASCSTVPPTQSSKLGSVEIAWLRAGAAPPTVVFQSGLGDGLSPWAAVIARLPPSLAVFAYDRPGYGASRPAPIAPRSPCEVARELHSVLAAAGAAPPYVLVGHSLGGQYQYAFARLFPETVGGLLLLDPTHPDHWASMQRETPGAAAAISALRATVFSAAMKAEFDGQALCLDTAPPMTKVVPTRVLVSTRPEVGQTPAFRSFVGRLASDWLAKLPGSTMQAIDGAGHYIQTDKPDVVAAEIRTLLVGIANKKK